MVDFVSANVFHKRLKPLNIFCYKAGYIILSIVKTKKAPWFFSLNKFNLFSFYDKDHGYRGKKSITVNFLTTSDWVYNKLESVNLKKNDICDVLLLTHPRCLGFVFNPVSFYFCINVQNQIIAIIAEVNNTFGQTHSYIICEEDLKPISDGKVYKTKKEFFVSPFFQTEGYYEFRFFCEKMLDYTNNKQNRTIGIFINYFKGEDLTFETSLISNLKKFNAKNSFPYIFTTFKTVILIGFQAFVLKFIKKVKFRRAPKQLDKNITKNFYD